MSLLPSTRGSRRKKRLSSKSYNGPNYSKISLPISVKAVKKKNKKSFPEFHHHTGESSAFSYLFKIERVSKGEIVTVNSMVSPVALISFNVPSAAFYQLLLSWKSNQITIMGDTSAFISITRLRSLYYQRLSIPSVKARLACIPWHWLNQIAHQMAPIL